MQEHAVESYVTMDKNKVHKVGIHQEIISFQVDGIPLTMLLNYSLSTTFIRPTLPH